MATNKFGHTSFDRAGGVRCEISEPAHARLKTINGAWNDKNMKIAPLEDSIVSVKVRLAVMWAVILFFYVYNDIFLLLQNVRQGAGPSANPPGEVKMLAYALLITPAALMPLLCLVGSPSVIRWVNLVLGAAYFVLIIWTLTPAETALFYRFIGCVENIVTLGVIWTAWRWPRDKRD